MCSYIEYRRTGPLWLGIAIQHAKDARAHDYNYMEVNGGQYATSGRKRHNLLKRLWWCCIICDRTVSLTCRQSIMVTNSFFDFDDKSKLLCSADLVDEVDASRVFEPMTKILVAGILENLVELCVLATDVLLMSSLVYNNSSSFFGHSSMRKISQCKIRLQQWYLTRLKQTLEAATSICAQDSTLSRPKKSVALFASTVEMYYQ
ncbi:hypothetical protein FALCPG4_016155 [Fusarium falciforme]